MKRNMVTSNETKRRRRTNVRVALLAMVIVTIIGTANSIANHFVPCPEGDVACRLN